MFPPRKDKPKTKPEKRGQPVPMQQRYQGIVRELYWQITTKASPDHAIKAKYGIGRYDLVNEEKEPVEAYVYDERSKAYPMIEEQAKIRATSLIAAAKHVLQKAGREEKNELDLLLESFNEAIYKLYDQPVNSKKDFESQMDEVSTLVDQLLNNIAYIWGKNHPDHLLLTKKHYEAFFKELAAAVEEVTPDYKRNQIFTVNTSLGSFQYIERGVADEKGSKSFPSSHNRAKAGLTNFAAAVSGYLDFLGEPIVTGPGDFSHASFPAYDFYKREKSQAKVQGYYSPESVSIATQNMLALEREIRKRITSKEEKGDAPLNWISMGLLTAIDDKEQQKRILYETILAADRIRSRDKDGFNPITFDFGVNFAATKQSTGLLWAASRAAYTYTPEQNHENQRAFFQLQRVMLESLKSAVAKIGSEEKSAEQAPIVELFKCYSKLSEKFEHFELLEAQINKAAKKYDAAMVAFERANPPSEDDRRAVNKAEIELNRIKGVFMTEANNYFTEYTAAYQKVSAVIREYIQRLEGLPLTSPLNSVRSVLKDFAVTLDLFLNATWMYDENNFQLQKHIVDLGKHLEVVNQRYPSPSGPSHCACSFFCKSRDDRSAVLAEEVAAMDFALEGDEQTEPRLQPQAVPLDKDRHAAFFVSSATCIIPIQDTDGGGPKFGGKSVDPLGHPDRDYAKLQGKTAVLATKQLFKKKLEALAALKTFNPQKAGLLEPGTAHRQLQADVTNKYGTSWHAAVFQDALQTKNLLTEDYVNLARTIFREPLPPLDRREFIAHVIREFNLQYQYEDTDKTKAMMKFLQTYLAGIARLEDGSNVFDEQKSAPVLKKESKQSSSQLFSKSALLAQDVSTFAAWEKAIYRPAISLTGKHFFHKDTKETSNIGEAYQAWEVAKSEGDLVNAVHHLSRLQAAVTAWIAAKHGGSQYSSKGDLHEDSRLPAMLALQNFVKDELAAGQVQLYKEFMAGTLFKPKEKSEYKSPFDE